MLKSKSSISLKSKRRACGFSFRFLDIQIVRVRLLRARFRARHWTRLIVVRTLWSPWRNNEQLHPDFQRLAPIRGDALRWSSLSDTCIGFVVVPHVAALHRQKDFRPRAEVFVVLVLAVQVYESFCKVAPYFVNATAGSLYCCCNLRSSFLSFFVIFSVPFCP